MGIASRFSRILKPALHEGGAAIPEFLIVIPVILACIIGILEAGRLVNQSSYLKVISFNSALLAAGLTDARRNQNTIDRAEDQYSHSAANQVQATQFQVAYNDIQRTVTVDYGAALKEYLPQALLPVSLRGTVTLPYLARPRANQLSEDPTNDGNIIYCANGSISDLTYGCNGPPPPPPPCIPGTPGYAYCSGNNPCGDATDSPLVPNNGDNGQVRVRVSGMNVQVNERVPCFALQGNNR